MVSTPDYPDPYTTAAADQSVSSTASQQAATINNPDIYTPYGSQVYSVAGYDTTYDAQGNPIQTPHYQSTTTLSPDQMALYGLQTQTGYNMGTAAVDLSAGMGDYISGGIDKSGMADWATYGQGPQYLTSYGEPTDTQGIQDAMMRQYDSSTKSYNAAQDAQLAARGLSPGSSQYYQVDKQRGDTRADQVDTAYLAAYDEARKAADFTNQWLSQGYQDANTYAGSTNALRQAQYGEAVNDYTTPINTIASLMSGTQMAQAAPQYQSWTGQSVASPDIASSVDAAYQADAASAAATNQGLFGLATAPLSSSGFWGLF